MTTTTTKPSFDPIKLACWVGIAVYVANKVLRLQRGEALGEVFDFGNLTLWGLMAGACVVGLILRSPKMRRSAMLIEANETRAVTLSFLTGFTVMAVYYILRPVRDSMASDWTDAEISQLWTIQFFLSLGLVMLYGLACSKIRFRLLVPAVYTFYAVTFALFYVGASFVADRVLLDKAFYVWVSLFSLFHLSVFWSFMADTFSSEQSKRLFPFIASGTGAGATFGTGIVALIANDIGNDSLLLLGAVVLLLTTPMILFLQRLKIVDLHNESVHANLAAVQMGGKWWQGFHDFVRSPYLLAFGLFVLLYTAINAFIYFETTELLRIYEAREERTTILASRDAIVNILTFGLGLFVTNRIVRRLGMPLTMALLPIFCVIAFVVLAMAPILAVLLAVDIARRAGEYGITRPAREMLFTSVDRETRFKTKPVVDVVVYRGGDAWWGVVFAFLSDTVGFAFAAMSLIGAGIAALWVASGVYLGRAFQRQEAGLETPEAGQAPRRETVAEQRT
jgi:ATP:ADP antiporter, AAA family